MLPNISHNSTAATKAKQKAIEAGMTPAEAINAYKADPQGFVDKWLGDTAPAPQSAPAPDTAPAPAPTAPAAPRPGSLEEMVVALIHQHAPQAPTARTLTVDVTRDAQPVASIEGAHKALPDLLSIYATGEYCYMAGPAGSGKTTLAMQLAKATERQFWFSGAVSAPHELFGFRDANGVFHHTSFTMAFIGGGIFLLDEIDRSAPEALIPLNAALANGVVYLQDGKQYEAHPDFYAIAAANTLGTGGDRVYTTAEPLDGSTRDRFATLVIDYDPDVEARMAPAEVVDVIQRIRAFAHQQGWPLVVSPRATRRVGLLTAKGMPLRKALLIGAIGAFSHDQQTKVLSHVL